MSYGPHHKAIAKQAKRNIGVEWYDELESGETIDSVSVTVLDESGNDASTILTGSPFISNTRTFVTKDENSGTPGSYYYLIFTVTTSEGNILGGDQHGTIKLKVTKNY